MRKKEKRKQGAQKRMQDAIGEGGKNMAKEHVRGREPYIGIKKGREDTKGRGIQGSKMVLIKRKKRVRRKEI